MAVEGQHILVINIPAGADLSAIANQYKGVIHDGSGGVVVATANTDDVIGILQNRPKSGVAAEILVIGHSKFRAGAAISVGALLGVQADGEFETLAAANPTRYWFGRALESAGAAGDIASGVFNFVVPVPALTAN